METTFATFALGIACSNYVGRQRMVKEAENWVITARTELKAALEDCEAEGLTPEEIDQVFEKYGLSCEEISNRK